MSDPSAPCAAGSAADLETYVTASAAPARAKVQPQWLLDSKKQLAAFNSTLSTLQGSLRTLHASIASMRERESAAARAAADAAATRARGPPDSTLALPSEAVLLVLGMLGPRDIAAAACCNLRWHTAAADPLLWSTVLREQWVHSAVPGGTAAHCRRKVRVLSAAFASCLFLVDAWLPSGDSDRVWFQYTQTAKSAAKRKGVQLHELVRGVCTNGDSPCALHIHFPHLLNWKRRAAVPLQRQTTIPSARIWQRATEEEHGTHQAKHAGLSAHEFRTGNAERGFRGQLLDCLHLTNVLLAAPLVKCKLQELLALGLVPTLRALCMDDASSVRELAACALAGLLAHPEEGVRGGVTQELRLRNTHASLRQHLRLTVQADTALQRGRDLSAAGALPSPWLAALLCALALPPNVALPTAPWLAAAGAATAAVHDTAHESWLLVHCSYPSGGHRIVAPPPPGAFAAAKTHFAVAAPAARDGALYDGAMLLRLLLLPDGTAVGQGFDGRPCSVYGRLAGSPQHHTSTARAQMGSRLVLSCCHRRDVQRSPVQEPAGGGHEAEQALARVFGGLVPTVTAPASALAAAAAQIREEHLAWGSDYTWEVHCDGRGGLMSGRGGVGVWRTEQAVSARTGQRSVSLGTRSGGGVGGAVDAGLAQLLAVNAAAASGAGGNATGGGQRRQQSGAAGTADGALGLIRVLPCASLPGAHD